MPPLPINMASTLTEQAAKLLDFNQKLDINLLDNVVSCMYAGEGQQVRKFSDSRLSFMVRGRKKFHCNLGSLCIELFSNTLGPAYSE